jgi:hypothetical protein
MFRPEDDANEPFRARDRVDFKWTSIALVGFMLVDWFWLQRWS